MKILILFLALAGIGYADVTPTAGSGETAVYFEPTQADKDCCHVAITEQQDKYREAVGQKNYHMARALALFHFTRAWSWFNEAMSIARDEEGWMNVTELKKAQDLIANAQSDVEQAKLKGHHMKGPQGVLALEALVSSNRVRIEEQIAALLK